MMATMRTNESEKVRFDSVVGLLLDGRAVAMVEPSRERG